jgi:hypothetical protein
MTNEVEVTTESESPDNSTLYLGLGLGLGGYVTATTILAGVACPVCAVAAPALIATGVYQKVRNRKRRHESKSRNMQLTGQLTRS